ncbi:transcriptional regulator [Glutamicibacter bergerei]|uniref:transcriptional regulator n=1 Tax=Glutamicibacter sp. BW77 TaxID=2024402 RepID=UPI000BB80C90|nr:transcriptional regulator [Glutamicibacter sp. BW77]PCC36520.1 transcriptional regulator [Glutamicibacter sp. BW77]
MRAEPYFNEAIHAPTRLRLCALLRPLAEADFAVIAATLELSEANLSKTVRNLVEIGYLVTSKQASPQRTDARQTTKVKLTAQGRRAFDGHLAALRSMAGD